MNDLPDNELFSAYLDGELTAAEQAQVEQLLASSPAARQLLDELRALSNTLQALPQERLDQDFGQRVMRVVERRMLTGSETEEKPQTSTEPPRVRRRFSMRTLLWPAIAVAVGLLLMVMDSGPLGRIGNQRQVAVAPREEARAPREEALERREQPEEPVEAAFKSNSGPASSPVIGKLTDRDAMGPAPLDGTLASDHRAVENENKPFATAMRAKSADGSRVSGKGNGMPPAEAAADAPTSPRPAPALAPTPRAPQAGAEAVAAAKERPVIQPPKKPGGLPEILDKESSGNRVAAGEKATGPAAPEDSALQSIAGRVAAPFAKAGDGLIRRGTQTFAQAEGGGGAPGGRTALELKSDAAKEGRVGSAGDEELLVVHCDLSPHAARSQAFANLLTANGIAWEPPAPSADMVSRNAGVAIDQLAEQAKSRLMKREEKSSGNGTIVAAPGENLAQHATEGAGRAADVGATTRDTRFKRRAPPVANKLREAEADKSLEAAQAAGDVEIVYVEATPAQIEATLAGLQRQPEQFFSVSVSPSPGSAAQQSWDQYSRPAQGRFRQDDRSEQSREELALREQRKNIDQNAAGDRKGQVAGGRGRARRVVVPLEDRPGAGQQRSSLAAESVGQPRPAMKQGPAREPLAERSQPALAGAGKPGAPPMAEPPAPGISATGSAAHVNGTGGKFGLSASAADKSDSLKKAAAKLATSADEAQKAKALQSQQSAQTARALFVLRVVGPDLPTVADSLREKQAEAAKAAVAAPPAASARPLAQPAEPAAPAAAPANR